MNKKGRPIIPDHKKKRSVSISVTPYHLQILSKLCEQNNVSRSHMIGVLIEGAGLLELGVTGMPAKHLMPNQKFLLHSVYPFGDIFACNPHSMKGKCQHDACQAAYKKVEGLK